MGWGGGRENKKARVGFPQEKRGEATAGCHFPMRRWKLAAEYWTRESGLSDLARRQSVRGPRPRRQSWVAGLNTPAGLKPPPKRVCRGCGRSAPGSRAPPYPTPPGRPNWAEAGTRARPEALRQGLPPETLAAPSFLPCLSSFALTKASLGAFLGGAILPDSMLSCPSSSGERGLLARSSLRLHPCGVWKAGLQSRPAGCYFEAATQPGGV